MIDEQQEIHDYIALERWKEIPLDGSIDEEIIAATLRELMLGLATFLKSKGHSVEDIYDEIVYLLKGVVSEKSIRYDLRDTGFIPAAKMMETSKTCLACGENKHVHSFNKRGGRTKLVKITFRADLIEWLDDFFKETVGDNETSITQASY